MYIKLICILGTKLYYTGGSGTTHQTAEQLTLNTNVIYLRNAINDIISMENERGMIGNDIQVIFLYIHQLLLVSEMPVKYARVYIGVCTS